MAEAQTVPPQAPEAQQPTATGEIDEKSWALFTHLSLLTNLLSGLAFLGPLVIWLVNKDKSPTLDAHGKEALNFGITITIANVIGAVLMIVLIGFLVWLAAFVVWLIFMIQGTMAANKGEMYRYPMSIRFIK